MREGKRIGRVAARASCCVFLLLGCGKLLGIDAAKVQAECQSRAQCAPGYDCLLGSCRDECVADAECGGGARCLKAIGTSACIPADEGCGSTCPDGTICQGEVCRTSCSSDDDCAGGQSCHREVCASTDPAREPVGPQAGGAPNGGGTNAIGGSAGAGPMSLGGSAGEPSAASGAAGDGPTPPGGAGDGAGGEPSMPQVCSPACAPPTPLCVDGECVPAKSCVDAEEKCGPSGVSKCCEQGQLPGGSVLRSYDGVTANGMNADFPANVSKFSLDLLEVTVGRFRRFVNDGGGRRDSAPAAGSGSVHGNPDSGWDAAWNVELVESKEDLVGQLACHAFSTWTNAVDTSGNGEARPINCVTWYEAQAFCIWDGGRLPSEAEWNYAAAGGEQRVYPWSVGPSSTEIDCARTSYYSGDETQCCGDGKANNLCEASDIVTAGSKSGKGFWEHRDLAGNVQEWVFDYFAPVYKESCTDCVQTTTAKDRVRRGGSYFSTGAGLYVVARRSAQPFARGPETGFRCAYEP